MRPARSAHAVSLHRFRVLLLLAGIACGWSAFTPIVRLPDDLANSSDLGFRILPPYSGFRLGEFVAVAGDVNGDGIDDVVVGSPFVNGESGAAHILFGRRQWGADVQLSDDPVAWNGVELLSDCSCIERAGYLIRGVGDVNVDGVDDLVVTSVFHDATGSDSGRIFLLFGRADWPTTPTKLGQVNKSFYLDGDGSTNVLGTSVVGYEDFNGDGVPDIATGVYGAAGETYAAGKTFVLWGHRGEWAHVDPLPISTVNVTTFLGEGVEDYSGNEVALGDVNGDGIADIIIGASRQGQDDMGCVYVVFGHRGAHSPVTLSRLNGTDGFSIRMTGLREQMGTTVWSADFDGDAIADIITGSPFGGDGSRYQFDVTAGKVHIVFGRREWPRVLNLSARPNAVTAMAGTEERAGLGLTVPGPRPSTSRASTA
eukprot:m51a1_g12574 hypothetical protein (426) ;mRNA; r:37-1408